MIFSVHVRDEFCVCVRVRVCGNFPFYILFNFHVFQCFILAACQAELIREDSLLPSSSLEKERLNMTVAWIATNTHTVVCVCIPTTTTTATGSHDSLGLGNILKRE